MATPWADGRQFLAPGDTTDGNEKVVEPGLLGGSSASSCASPTPGASKSAAVHNAVASFMETSCCWRYELAPGAIALRQRGAAYSTSSRNWVNTPKLVTK